MAENFDPSPLINALNQLNEATEKTALAQMGVARSEDGRLTALKTRAEIEDKINKELIATYRADKFYADKQKTLYKEQLSNLGYIVGESGKIAKAIGSAEMTVAQKRQIARLTELDRKQKETVEAQVNLGKNIKQGAVDFSKNMASFGAELARGNTSFTMLNPIIDTVANSLAGFASAIPVLGGFLSASIKATAEGAKFILELAQKNIQVFQDLSSGGAIFVNGMQGVSDNFLEAGMSMEGFTKVIKENGETLARYQGTIAGGAIEFTKAVGMLTKDKGPLAEAGMELRKLGLTADNIGERAAAFLEQEIRLGRNRTMSAEQLAKGTVAYTKELLALQKVTGMTREEAESERKRILNMARFRATTNEMREGGQGLAADRATSFMARLPDEIKSGFEETFSGTGGSNFGTFAQSFGQAGIDLVNQLRAAVTEKEVNAAEASLEKMLPILAAQRAKELQQVGKATTETGSYSIPILSNMAGGLGNIGQAREGVAAGAATTDPKTIVAVKAQQKLEEFSNMMFEFGDIAMKKASEAVIDFTGVVRDFVEDYTGEGGDRPPGSPGATSSGNLNIKPDSGRARAAQANAEAGRLSPGEDPLSRLNFGGKRAERDAGYKSPALIEKANRLHDLFPGGEFTAFNDKHKRTNPAHKEGRALDFALNPSSAPKTPEEADIIKKQIKELGFSKVLDEYFRDVTKDTTGKHFHAEVSAKYGGIASGPQTGFPAMLHGPKEAIIPLATDSILEKMATTPASTFANSATGNTSDSMIISMLVDKFDAMINLLSNGNDIQDQLLRHSRI